MLKAGVPPLVPGSGNRGAILIKNWEFKPNPPDRPQLAPFTHFNHEVEDKEGIPGQGNKNPRRGFFNHRICLYNEKFYDPSYGTGPFDTQHDWEEASVAGYRIAFLWPNGDGTSSAYVINKEDDSDPDRPETIFTILLP